jgi:Mce-associated membrane protein
MTDQELASDVADLEPAGEPPRRSAALILAITLAVLFGIAAAVLGVLAADRDDGDPRQEDVRRTAGEFAEALVTYDYRDPDVHRDAVLALSTGSFRDEYEDAFEQGLARVITEAEATSTGTVKDIYLSELDEERAQAIVVVDIEHTGTGGPRTLFDVYMKLTFVEVDGDWKVDQVEDLNFDAGSAPTSTTVPASSTTSIP